MILNNLKKYNYEMDDSNGCNKLVFDFFVW